MFKDQFRVRKRFRECKYFYQTAAKRLSMLSPGTSWPTGCLNHTLTVNKTHRLPPGHPHYYRRQCSHRQSRRNHHHAREKTGENQATANVGDHGNNLPTPSPSLLPLQNHRLQGNDFHGQTKANASTKNHNSSSIRQQRSPSDISTINFHFSKKPRFLDRNNSSLDADSKRAGISGTRFRLRRSLARFSLAKLARNHETNASERSPAWVDNVLSRENLSSDSQDRSKRDLLTGWIIFPGTKW